MFVRLELFVGPELACVRFAFHGAWKSEKAADGV